MAHLFLIGPGGTGKTTTGHLLAAPLNRPFVDLDESFCEQISPIRSFLDTHGYAAYIRENSRHFHELLKQATEDTLFALSSGFLATDVEPEIVTLNRATIKQAGISILLLPAPDLATALSIVVERQLARDLSLIRESQIATFQARFEPYRQLGDIQIFSTEPPEAIVKTILSRLASRSI